MIGKKYLLIAAHEVQDFLKQKGHYRDRVDGALGPKTATATKALFQGKPWNDGRALVGTQQMMMKEEGFYSGEVDGLIGPQTRYAVELWQDSRREKDPPVEVIQNAPAVQTKWPRQADVRRVFGKPGENLVMLPLPFKMRLAWNTRQTVSKMQLHAKVADSAGRAFEKIYDNYGLKEITRLRLDLFGGSFNIRKMRGGQSLSMHSWGIAIDFDPDRNQLRWGADRASLDNKVYAPFWRAWEDEGWVSLGRQRNYDWMHVQAARL